MGCLWRWEGFWRLREKDLGGYLASSSMSSMAIGIAERLHEAKWRLLGKGFEGIEFGEW